MLVGGIRAEVTVQGLLDLTGSRLFGLAFIALENLIHEGVRAFHLHGKRGCDGSGNQSQYKQKFSDPTMDDGSLFLFTSVPLELRTSDFQPVIWRNPVPGSPRYCRPTKLIYEKESTATIIRGVGLVNDQI